MREQPSLYHPGVPVGCDQQSQYPQTELGQIQGVAFEAWQHDSLVRFAFEANKRIHELEVDRKLLLEAYRELLRRQ